MTDVSPAEPLISLKKSEWDAYRLYVAGLEGKVSAYETAAASKPVETDIPVSQTREDEHLSVAQRAVAPDTTKMRSGHVALYAIGWVFFVLQMIPPAITGLGLGMVLFTGASQEGKVVGGLFFLGLVVIYLLVILIHVRLWTRRRPLGVLLFGLLAPCLFWLPTLSSFMSF